MSVLVLNTLSDNNDEVLELQNQICASIWVSENLAEKMVAKSH